MVSIAANICERTQLQLSEYLIVLYFYSSTVNVWTHMTTFKTNVNAAATFKLSTNTWCFHTMEISDAS